MNFGIRKEEAEFIRDLIMLARMSEGGDEKLQVLYGNIDLDGMMRQLDIIVMLGDSVEEENVW